MPDKFLSAQGLKIRYADTGQGRPLVMLHGLGAECSADWWRQTAQSLNAAGHRTVALDMPGWGLSSRPASGWSFPLALDVLSDTIDALGLGPVVMVGHTLGGWTSAVFAAKRPELVRGLVLVNSAGLNSRVPGHAARYAAPSRDEVRKLFEFHLSDKALVTEAFVDEQYARYAIEGAPESYQATLDYISSPDVRTEWSLERYLPGVGCPTLVAWGGGDSVIPLASGERAAELAHDARLVVIPGGAHSPATLRPAEFAGEVHSFVACLPG